MEKDNRRRIGKKAMIISAFVDFFAIVVFVVAVVVFAVIYKEVAQQHNENLESLEDLSYGNYLAQSYLKKPISIGGNMMTMAELIALYDYNQTLQKAQGGCGDPFTDAQHYVECMGNPVGKQLKEMTGQFIKNNFPEDSHHMFVIRGSGFTYVDSGDVFIGSADMFISAFATVQVPKESYVTFIPSVDPQSQPIELYCFYDFKSFITSLPTEKRGSFLIASIFRYG